VEPLIGFQSNGKHLPLPANIRLVKKLIEMAKALAYYDPATITALKCFIVQVPELVRTSIKGLC